TGGRGERPSEGDPRFVQDGLRPLDGEGVAEGLVCRLGGTRGRLGVGLVSLVVVGCLLVEVAGLGCEGVGQGLLGLAEGGHQRFPVPDATASRSSSAAAWAVLSMMLARCSSGRSAVAWATMSVVMPMAMKRFLSSSMLVTYLSGIRWRP